MSVLAFLVIFLPAHAHSQDVSLFPEDRSEAVEERADYYANQNDDLFAQDTTQDVAPQKIPEKYMQEFHAFYEKCEGSVDQRIYYDCKCLATKLLDMRMKDGPTEHVTSFQLRMKNECRDATEAAGMAYTTCVKNVEFIPESQTPEEYCSCYANTFAELVNKLESRIQSRTIVPLKVQARIACENPELALGLFGIRTSW